MFWKKKNTQLKIVEDFMIENFKVGSIWAMKEELVCNFLQKLFRKNQSYGSGWSYFGKNNIFIIISGIKTHTISNTNLFYFSFIALVREELFLIRTSMFGRLEDDFIINDLKINMKQL